MFLQANQRARWRNVQNERWHKTILAGNETLPIPSQPVGVTSVTLAEITHFSVGHAPPGQLKCFLESPDMSRGYLRTCLLMWVLFLSLYFLPDVPSPTAAELLSPKISTMHSGPSPLVLCSVSGVSELWGSCPSVLEKKPCQSIYSILVL